MNQAAYFWGLDARMFGIHKAIIVRIAVEWNLSCPSHMGRIVGKKHNQVGMATWRLSIGTHPTLKRFEVRKFQSDYWTGWRINFIWGVNMCQSSQVDQYPRHPHVSWLRLNPSHTGCSHLPPATATVAVVSFQPGTSCAHCSHTSQSLEHFKAPGEAPGWEWYGLYGMVFTCFIFLRKCRILQKGIQNQPQWYKPTKDLGD